MAHYLEAGGLALEVALEGGLPSVILRDLQGRVYSSGLYRYAVVERGAEGPIPRQDLSPDSVEISAPENDTVEIIAQMAEVPLAIRHVFRRSGDFLEETISLSNRSNGTVHLADLDFGFAARLGADLAGIQFVAVPYRRQADGKLHHYSVEDLAEGRFSNSDWCNDQTVLGQDLVDTKKLRSEGWILTDGSRSLLCLKYNPEHIEYCLLRPEAGPAARLVFGSASLALYSEPRDATELKPGEEFAFGGTYYRAFRGDWPEGYRIFKGFMNAQGHDFPPDYDPPVNWNELFDVGWYHSDRELLFEHYTPDALLYEAQKAREMGAELLYLDPGWEVCEGTTLWDEERLGPVGDLSERLKADYALGLGYRTVGRLYRDEFPREWYLQRTPEPQPYERPLLPKAEGPDTEPALSPLFFWEVCTQCEEWKKEKLRRISAITSQGVKFMMFDEFDWRGPCYNPDHGHPVPSTPEGHVRAIYWLVRETRMLVPDLLVEAHDPVWPWFVRYLPTYFRQGFENGDYQENWGFEFMWNPIEDLRHGPALVLYYYNLAYNIPLYDHITMEGDNDNALSFWWYASTVRHLAIGGKKGLNSPNENEPRFQAYKQAMAKYLALKPFFVRGEFIGIDELTHVHVLPGQPGGVLVALNLDKEEQVEREVAVWLSQMGLSPEDEVRVEGAEFEVRSGEVALMLQIPPESAVVVTLTPATGKR